MNRLTKFALTQIRLALKKIEVRDRVVQFTTAVKQKSAQKRFERYPFLNTRFRADSNMSQYICEGVTVTIFVQPAQTFMEICGHVGAMVTAAPDENGKIIPLAGDVFIDERMMHAPAHVKAAVFAHEAAHVIYGDVLRDPNVILTEEDTIRSEIRADAYATSIGFDMGAALVWMRKVYNHNMTDKDLRIMDIRIDAIQRRGALYIIPDGAVAA